MNNARRDKVKYKFRYEKDLAAYDMGSSMYEPKLQNWFIDDKENVYVNMPNVYQSNTSVRGMGQTEAVLHSVRAIMKGRPKITLHK